MMMDRRQFIVGAAGVAAAVPILSASSVRSFAESKEEISSMSDITLQSGSLTLHLATQGGAITGFWQQRDGGAEPIALLRPLTDGTPSCFPLVPFGNRVRDNRFRFDGRDYQLSPNTDWDRHYLHGEGWQANWSIIEQNSNRATLQFEHHGGESGYNYQARQFFALSDKGLEITLIARNVGTSALPFGLGWHPYFLTPPQTTLWAPVQKFWTEIEEYLPGEAVALPDDVNFNQPAPLPDHWVNNGLQGWLGKAIIRWPQWRTQLHLDADPLFRHAFIFVPGEGAPEVAGAPTDFGSGYFCFEPMSHLANGHNLPDLGNLTVLSPGEEVSGSIRLRPQII